MYLVDGDPRARMYLCVSGTTVDTFPYRIQPRTPRK